jgi:type I restriction enzyme M protein
VLTPGRFVGTGDADEDAEPFAEKVARLSTSIRERIAASREIDARIEKTLRLFSHV